MPTNQPYANQLSLELAALGGNPPLKDKAADADADNEDGDDGEEDMEE